MLNTLHIQRGVTLIEMMITLTIAAILLTIGAPSISDWVQNTRIHTSAESIMSGLHLARAEAVRRNVQVQFQLTGTAPHDGSWTAGCVTPDGTNCPAVIQSRTSAEGSTAGIQALTSEVDAATNAPAGTVIFTGTLIFNGLGRVVTSALTAGDNAVIDIENPTIDNCLSDPSPGTMRCLRIVVSSGGQIRMCDPALSLTSNPQGCLP